jgi:pyruvate/2-oxoglutarate dehydrogenase complex dihydrolipoamide acyltransferase (E2) component
VAERTFELPDLGEGLIDAVVLEWLAAEGDYLERGQAMAEVETTKSTVELPSPQAGTISKFHVAEGDTAVVGEAFVTFTVADDEAGIVGTVPTDKPAARRVKLALTDD